MDASFIPTIVFRDDFEPAAFAMAAQWKANGVSLVAPALFQPEVTSVVRERAYRVGMLPSEARATLDYAFEWPVEIWPTDDPRLQRRAYELAERFNRPKAYDAQYLAVADLLGCELWTADRRLHNTVSEELPWVHHVGDYA